MIIVTGGAGFIGSAIVAGLNDRGADDILIVDALGVDEKWKNLRNLRYTDYVEADDVFELLAAGQVNWSADALIHVRACSASTEPGRTFSCYHTCAR